MPTSTGKRWPPHENTPDFAIPQARFRLIWTAVAVSHRELLQAVWGPDYGDQVEYLRVFINQLRKKIEPNPGNPQYLLTEPWMGYRFNLPSEP
jgi:hypothetical protein